MQLQDQKVHKQEIISYLLYIPMFAFLDYYAPVNVDVFVECGMCMGDIQVVP